jgi:hypothetical protein
MKCVTLEEFMKLKIKTDKDFEKTEALCVEVFKFHPAKIMVCLDEYDGQTSFHSAEVRLLHADIEITVRHDEYRKKYHIIANMERNFKNINHYTIEEVKKDLNRPNDIGVLSSKKILEWINYYEAIYSRLYRKDKENGSEKDLFLKSLDGLPVEWSKDKKQGWIVRNGIKFSFTIGETYVSEKMEIDYSVSTSIATFKKLSDNKYKDTDS